MYWIVISCCSYTIQQWEKDHRILYEFLIVIPILMEFLHRTTAAVPSVVLECECVIDCWIFFIIDSVLCSGPTVFRLLLKSMRKCGRVRSSGVLYRYFSQRTYDSISVPNMQPGTGRPSTRVSVVLYSSLTLLRTCAASYRCSS